MNYLKVVLIFSLLLLQGLRSLAEPIISFTQTGKVISIGRQVSILEDSSGQLKFEAAVKSTAYKPATTNVPNLGVSNSTFWVKFIVKNESENDRLLLELDQPTIDQATLYTIEADGRITEQAEGEFKKYGERRYNNQNHVFDLHVQQGETHTYYLKVKSAEQMVLPMFIGDAKPVMESLMNKDVIFGIFFGIMLVMLLYNLFIYFTTKDKGYLYYVLYILLLCLSQASLSGYAFRFLWPNSPWIAENSVYLFPAVAGLAAMVFVKEFLQTKIVAPKLTKVLNVLIGIFVLAILCTFFGFKLLSFNLMQLNTAIGSLFVLYLSAVVLKRGNKSALFFLIAWSVLLIGATVFVLKDFGVFPYNNFTSSILAIGSAIEVVLLSFALANKISILRKERETAQAQAMQAVEENARIVREQNIILEAKVTERTQELKTSNEELNKTLKDLKEAEMQLVESEKMASLGQLTAGIAHEINNPINFVTSNVKPLKRDVQMVIDMLNQIEEISLQDGSVDDKKQKIDELKQEYDFDYLKTEIDYLINGINEGSSRTAEIVKGLRIFSRLDEDDLKKADINEGLESTLVIVNNQLDNRIDVIKQFSELPLVECYPGKLNQVFMNMISNALHAIKSRYKEDKGGVLTISTSASDTHVLVSIKDNGTGMDENTKKKLFEPFFTTKDVGEGTGLGLSIAYNTIVKHNGSITVNSELGAGTEFIIEIPIIHQN
ncbi:MAG TPA: 7TM diverse intracellular signaling domain-containing protein [Flavipsychrobacter sp.]|nr:7TM diverse intracellular signaling domain-containing protein [Flavipsychrobacter sp.]